MGHRTAKVIAGLGVRWLALVGAQGPENSLTTGSRRRVADSARRAEKKKVKTGWARRRNGARKGASAKNMTLGPTRAPG